MGGPAAPPRFGRGYGTDRQVGPSMTLTSWILVGVGAYFLQSIVLTVALAMLLRHRDRVDASKREVEAFKDAPLTRERHSPANRTASTRASVSEHPSVEPTIESSPSAARRRAM
jgi:hypothetical protein